jgi:hypothetical protein
LFCQVFVNSVTYGVGIGSLPSVDNINIAGACRQIVLNNSSDRSQTSFSNIFAESLYSIGTSNSPSTIFTGCRFVLTPEKSSPLIVFSGNTSVGPLFSGCYIGYYGSPNRVMVFSTKTRFDNCAFEGFPTGKYTNFPSEELNTLMYRNCRVVGTRQTISNIDNLGKVYDNIPVGNFSSQMGVPCKGVEIGFQTFKMKATGYLYKSFSESQRPLTYNAGNPYYISATPGRNRAGDALLLFASLVDSATSLLSSGYVMVKRVSGDSVFIEPNSYSRWYAKSNYNIWPITFYFDSPHLPEACATTAGTLFLVRKDKGTLSFSGGNSAIGARIYGPGISAGTYVTGGNSDTIFISRAVQASRSYAYYKFFDHIKETSEDNTTFVFDLGDKYIVKTETVYEEYTCSTIGRQTGFQVPVFTKTYPVVTLVDGDKGDIDVTSGGTVWTVDTSAITAIKIADANVTWPKLAQAVKDSINAGGGGGSVFAGTGISISSDTIYNTGDLLAANEGVLGVGAGSSTSSTILSNTTGANAVTLNAGSGITISESTSSNGGSITVNAVDVSATNEIQSFLSVANNPDNLQITLDPSGGSFKLTAGTGIDLNTTGTNTVIRCTGDTVVTNEGILGVGSGSSTTAVILSNTSGAAGVTIEAGTNITITESPSANGGTITISSSGGAGVTDTLNFMFAASDEGTNLTTGTAKITFRAPHAMTLVGIRASVNTAPVGSTIIVDVNEAGTSIFSTRLSIDASEKTSVTAAVPPVFSDTAIANDAEITVDIDQVGSSTAGKGLKITLYYTK